MSYPVKKYKNNYQAQKRSKQNKNTPPINLNGAMSVFETKTSNYGMRNGRTECRAIEKTAIITDKYGNRVVLKQHETHMNTDSNGPNLRYTTNKDRFSKRKK